MCSMCGNEIMVIAVGGGELACCGEPMEEILED
ncbi:MAG: desulfoferrodoxin [Deltaproteobacteria bacterium]|nr:desulfoferrodoxin [Deltaproteobacteria bacterium]